MEVRLKLFGVVTVMLVASAPAFASTYAFTPLPAGFTATALNDVGQIAGLEYPPGAAYPVAAIDTNGTVATIVLPSAASFGAQINAINNAGTLLVETNNGRAPYLFANGASQPFAAPGNTSAGVQAYGLNNIGDVVGSANVSTSGGASVLHGYVSTGPTFSYLDAPGATTFPIGVNDLGHVVGGYTDTGSPEQGFLYDGSSFASIRAPGADLTLPAGINDLDTIVGTYFVASSGQSHGFVDAAGVSSDIVGPTGAAFLPVGLNNAGQLIGTFGGGGLSYLASPQQVPEPDTAALLATALVAAGLMSTYLGSGRRKPPQV